MLEELKLLLADDEVLYNCPDKKQELLMSYAKACENCTSGGTALVPIAAICENLEHKAEWMIEKHRGKRMDIRWHGWRLVQRIL